MHGVGGIVGAILTGVFVSSAFGGSGLEEGVTVGAQVLKQILGVVVTIVFTSIVTLIILKIVDAVVGLRVSEEQETQGLDIAQHDERGYSL